MLHANNQLPIFVYFTHNLLKCATITGNILPVISSSRTEYGPVILEYIEQKYVFPLAKYYHLDEQCTHTLDCAHNTCAIKLEL